MKDRIAAIETPAPCRSVAIRPLGNQNHRNSRVLARRWKESGSFAAQAERPVASLAEDHFHTGADPKVTAASRREPMSWCRNCKHGASTSSHC